MGGQVPVRTSVVIPVWDAYVAGHLIDAVRSLREQEVPVRIIVVDNASQVALPVLPGVAVLRSRTRLSLGEARNFGLTRVSTPYVIFWDADDIMLPGTLASLEEGISADAGLAGFGEAIVEDLAGRRHRWPRPWVAVIIRRPRAFALIDAVWSSFPTTGATILRTEVVREAGGFPATDSGEDWCLGVCLALRGKLGWSERPGRLYRIHGQSVSARRMSARHQLRHAATVRARIRSDERAPALFRSGLPLIAAAQLAAVLLHEIVSAVRRARPSR